MTDSLSRIFFWVAGHGETGLALAGLVALAVAGKSFLASGQPGEHRAELGRQKELRKLADRICLYGRRTHERYPTGNVVVSVRDLAGYLRKRPDAVAAALALLLDEQRVQRAPVPGYWKLNIESLIDGGTEGAREYRRQKR